MKVLTSAATLAWMLLLTAAQTPAAAQDAATPEADAPAEAPEAEPAQEPVTIPLDGTLRFIIQPTILGLVPPRGPAGYGEVFVRIVAAGPGEVAVHYEIKEEVPLPEGEEATPGRHSMTRIRRGEITATGIRRSPAILPPLYWGDGNLDTASALLWLSAESFAALSEEGSCPLDLLNCGPVDSAAAAELTAAAQELIEAAELGEGAVFTLDLLEPGMYPCVVNGERVRLSALHARDSLGLAEYWLLDDPGNPLVLKLTYTMGDAGQDGGMSFVQKGGGYAITSIDFSPGWEDRR